MYKDVKFGPTPLDWVEQDLAEIADFAPRTKRLQLVGADPFCLSYKRLKRIAEMAHEHLPELEIITTAARVTNITNKTVDQLAELRELGLAEIFLGTESGDDWTLKRIDKGYTSKNIVEQSRKLDQAGIRYWHTFLNGVAGASHSRQHAVNTAKVFNKTNPIVVGTGALVLFPGVELGREAKLGQFDPQTEKGLMSELRLFLEHLECDSHLITHHTNAMSLNGPFLQNKQRNIDKLSYSITHLDERMLAERRRMKMTL